MSETAATLHLVEAVDLGHAWVQSLAAGRGIRLLLIKGPALHRHGLRAERVSADIDVLVEPARFAELCDAVAGARWTERPGIFISTRTTLHSRTFIHPEWPCDLDVHSFYPGFLADPSDVFEALWERRVPMDFAHRACDVPDRVSGALILALHSLRGSTLLQRHSAELDQLVAVRLTDEERADAAALALATGCAATLETVLPRLGVEVEPSAAELTSPALQEWRERVAAGSHGAHFWLVVFRQADACGKVVTLWNAFWPTRHDLLVARPETVDTVAGRTAARVRRWGRGIRSVPGALRARAARRVER